MPYTLKQFLKNKLAIFGLVMIMVFRRGRDLRAYSLPPTLPTNSFSMG